MLNTKNMSFEIKPDDLVTREKLEAVPYHQLRKTFQELGIESVWKSGTRKDDLVNDAMKELVRQKKAVEVIEEETGEKIDLQNELDKQLVDNVIEDIKVKETVIKEKKISKARFIKEEPKRVMYNLLLKRHYKDGVLDTVAVKKSKERCENRSTRSVSKGYQMDAHDEILQDYKTQVALEPKKI